MKINLGIVSIALSLVTILSLSGCGDSSSSSGTGIDLTGTNLTGTVATGEGASAEISFVGAQGNSLSGHSIASGVYSIDATSLTQPIMVRATLDSDGSILYSFAESSTGTVNITPLTSFIVDQAAQASGLSGGAAQLFQTYETVNTSNITTQIDTQTDELDTVLATQMGEDNVASFDHFNSEFTADHTGYDALLDNLDIVVHNDDVIIREGDITLDTLDYDIAVSEINATGLVYDITTGLAMNDVNVTFTDNTSESASVSTDVNGSFTLPIETMRTYTLTISANGYTTRTIPNVSSFVFTQENIGSIPMFPVGLTTNTNVNGQVIDGRTASTPVSNVTMTFRDGYNARIGDIVTTSQTDSNGNYSAILLSGVYTVELVVDGYASVYRNIEVYGDTYTWNTSMLAETTDTASNAFATVSLNWDSNPSDLDSHLTGQLDDGTTNRFHMYFGNKTIYSFSDTSSDEISTEEQAEINYARTQLEDITGDNLSDLTTMDNLYSYYEGLNDSQRTDMDSRMETYYTDLETTPEVDQVCSDGVIATLDRDRMDDSSGFLPETTTLCDVVDGSIYKYYVHQYSGSSTMSGGHAVVTVTTASGITSTFTAPTAGESGNDDIWHVFDIDSNGNIYPVNEIIGNGSSLSTLFASPSRVNSDNKPFITESDLVSNLSTK